MKRQSFLWIALFYYSKLLPSRMLPNILPPFKAPSSLRSHWRRPVGFRICQLADTPRRRPYHGRLSTIAKGKTWPGSWNRPLLTYAVPRGTSICYDSCCSAGRHVRGIYQLYASGWNNYSTSYPSSKTPSDRASTTNRNGRICVANAPDPDTIRTSASLHWSGYGPQTRLERRP